MTNKLKRYPSRKLDQKITLCVDLKTKERWERQIHKDRIPLPEDLRTHLIETLDKNDALLEAEKAS